MKIRTQQYLSAGVSAALLLFITITLTVTIRQVQDAAGKSELAGTIVRHVGEHRFVTFEYILHHHPRARTQWQQKYDSVTALLASKLYRESHEQEIINRLGESHRRLKEIFAAVVNNYESRGSSADDIALSQELEARLVGQLLESSQAKIDEAYRLARTSHDRLEAAENRQVVLVILSIVALGIILAANAILTVSNVLIPIKRLAQSAQIIGAGDLSHRSGIRNGNEIGALSQAFDQMSERLQASRAALDEKAAQLLEANKELESFSYSVSHDLRAPLRAIDGFGQRLLDSCRDKLDASAVHYLERIRAGTQLMAQLIEDLLDLSRVSRTKLHMQPVNLGALAQRVANELQQSEPQRRVEFSIEGDASVQGDERLLEIVFRNLLVNAWKFTSKRDHAQIEFGMTQCNDATAYFVRDNGAGFDMAYADKLFSPFQRLHTAAEFPGTGIGLVTVRRILQRHGGRVWAQAATDQGATFYFTFGKGVEHDVKTDIAG